MPDLTGAIRKVLDENESYKKVIDEVNKERTLGMKKSLLASAVDVAGRKVIKISEPVDMTMLRNAVTMIVKEASKTAVVAAFETSGKPQLLIAYTSDLVASGKNAQNDIKEAAKMILGGGGGQPTLATAGGKEIAGLKRAFEKLCELATK